jgi:hypothetical protein
VVGPVVELVDHPGFKIVIRKWFPGEPWPWGWQCEDCLRFGTCETWRQAMTWALGHRCPQHDNGEDGEGDGQPTQE